MAHIASQTKADEELTLNQKEEVAKINKIPVANLWLLIVYASLFYQEFYRELGSKKQSLEKNPDEIAALVAEILCSEVRRRIKRNLSFGYQIREADLGYVRGRINLLVTERNQLLSRGKVACRFDELTVDTERNRYVRDALECISKKKMEKSLKQKCRTLARTLRRMGVTGRRSTLNEASVHSLGRNDSADKKMIFAAKLAFNLVLPSEAEGKNHLPLPDRENLGWIYKIYEKGIAGFYKATLDVNEWKVDDGGDLHWPQENPSDGIGKILPKMHTDITLEHLSSNHRIIIDTKFKTITTQSNRSNKERLHSANLYQIYAYLRTQEGPTNDMANNASGMLLYPAINYSEQAESVTLHGHRLWVATVDLAAPATAIRKRLLKLVDSISDY